MDEGVPLPVKQHSQTMSWRTRGPVYLINSSQESRLLPITAPVSSISQCLMWGDNAAQTAQRMITGATKTKMEAAASSLLVHGHLS